MNWFHHRNRLEQAARKIHEAFELIIGDDMAQVQFTVTITVAPAALSEGATSGTAAFTQNVTGTQTLTTVIGGVAPINVSVDPASPGQLPPGVTATVDGGNLVLAGTPTASGTATVVLNIADSGA